MGRPHWGRNYFLPFNLYISFHLPAGPQNIEKGLKVLHLSAKECVTLFCQKHFSFVILCPKTSAGSLVSSWVSGPGAFSLAWPGAVSCHQTDVFLRSTITGRSLMSLAFINLRIRAGRYHKTDFSLISMTSKRSLTAGKRDPASSLIISAKWQVPVTATPEPRLVTPMTQTTHAIDFPSSVLPRVTCLSTIPICLFSCHLHTSSRVWRKIVKKGNF